jgi:hypothetical protein
MRFAITFICQQGDLEVKALLLAASLRRFLTRDVELIACLPTPDSRWGTVSAATLLCLESLGVRTVQISNVVDESYAIGNKVMCIDVATSADRTLFLDTDILCANAFDPCRWFAHGFNAKPADAVGFAGGGADWQAAYDMFGLGLPTFRMVTSVGGQVVYPYYNAGVVAAEANSGLGDVWADCCRTLAAADALWVDRSLPPKYPFLDQVALPIAVARAGFEVHLLTEMLNYPVNLRPLPADTEGGLPILCHYHRPEVIRREPALLNLVAELLGRHAGISGVMATELAWREVLDRTRTAAPRRSGTAGPRGVISGFPRSGTSYLCGLLHSLPNHVVMNEPQGVAPILNHTHRPWRLPLHYEMLRCKIIDGEAIENKVVDGRVVEDTIQVNEYQAYRPVVSREDFALWTKNTISYAMRLPQIRDVMPDALIVACIRHPLDTIASWISTFPHLRDAAVERFPVGSPGDRFLDARQRAQIAAIAACDAAPLRRALLWRHLAETFLINRHHIMIIRYEDLAADPAGTLSRILERLPRQGCTADTSLCTPSRPRTGRRVDLTPADVEAIRSTCGDVARELGYGLDEL